MTRPRVVVLDDYQGVAHACGPWERVEARIDLQIESRHATTLEELTRLLEGAEVVVAMRERTAFDAETLSRLPDLRLLVTTGMANAAIDLDAAATRGVTVCGTPSLGPPTAELTWALILALARRLPAELAATAAGQWQTGLGRDLAGATIGIIGLGRLGQRVARVADAFDMRVLAWSGNLTDEAAEAAGATRAPTLEHLLAEADVVSVHTRLSDRTRGLLDAPRLALLKPTALLVNTSRGPIIDTGALIAALHERRLAGAALDVFDVEPLPADSPLRTAPNLLLTPHIGYVTAASYQTFFTGVVEDLEAWLDGAPIRLLT